MDFYILSACDAIIGLSFASSSTKRPVEVTDKNDRTESHRPGKIGEVPPAKRICLPKPLWLQYLAKWTLPVFQSNLNNLLIKKVK